MRDREQFMPGKKEIGGEVVCIKKHISLVEGDEDCAAHVVSCVYANPLKTIFVYFRFSNENLTQKTSNSGQFKARQTYF